MRAFVYQDGKAEELPFAAGAAQFGSAGLVWLHLDGGADEAAAWVAAQADLPDLARTALLASETRPRSDLLAHGAVVNFRGLGMVPDDTGDPLVSIRFWAEAGRVISVSFRAPAALDAVVTQFLGGTIADPGDLLTAFADAISEDLDPAIAALGDQIDDCESKIESGGIYALRRRVTRARSDAIGLRRFVAPQRQALERLANAPIDWLDDRDRAHLRDAADRAARMAEELESVRERSALMHEELTDLRAEQMDARALVISVVALIFLPLTFITGLLGMNVAGIPFAQERWAFWGVTAFCMAVALVVLGWFVRHRWISRS